MGRITFGTIARLAIASLLVGMAMAYFGLRPADLVGWVVGLGLRLAAGAESYLGDAVSYMLIGAVVVVPIWLAVRFHRALTRPPRRDDDDAPPGRIERD